MFPLVKNRTDGSFDELQLLDASSAALLRDVLSWYWRFGGIIISCSVRPTCEADLTAESSPRRSISPRSSTGSNVFLPLCTQGSM